MGLEWTGLREGKVGPLVRESERERARASEEDVDRAPIFFARERTRVRVIG
jgi:hypothetical protein